MSGAQQAMTVQDVRYLDLVRAAVLAPTPHNNQPWRFSVGDGRLEIHLDTERTLPSDLFGMLDMLGIGGAIENACIAARDMGLQPDVEYGPGAVLPDRGTPQPVATIGFEPGGQPDPLFPYLQTRYTSRKQFDVTPLSESQIDRLSHETSGFPGLQLDWVTEREQIQQFSRIVHRLDMIRSKIETMHHELYHYLRLSSKEVEQTRDGLDVRTAELPPGGCALLRWLRPWSRMQWMDRLGLTRLFANVVATSVRRSGALGVLSVSEPTQDLSLDGGRLLQRIWLAAEAEGLAMQPIGIPPIFFGHVQVLKGERLPTNVVQPIQKLIDQYNGLVPRAAGRVMLTPFRVGIAPRAKIRALRRPAEEVFTYPEGEREVAESSRVLPVD